MSLYNAAVGYDPLATSVVRALGFDPAAIPRFRDAYVDPEGPSGSVELVIFTRTGGGNRIEYERTSNPTGDDPMNDDLRDHPCFLGDHDDGFDSTFAHFRYSVPEEYAELARNAVEYGKEVGYGFPKPMDRFKAVVEPLKSLKLGG